MTLNGLFLRPEKVIKGYLEGVRKRYINPFAFFAIGAGISLLIFSFFVDEYMAVSREMNSGQIEMMTKVLQNNPATAETFKDPQKLEAYVKDTMQTTENVQTFILKYYNLMAFLLLPFYALIAFLTYRNPYNFGEHLAINAYIQGVTFLFTAVLFMLSVWINPQLYGLVIILVIVYYSYAYTRVYRHSFAELLLKLIIFFAVTLLLVIIIMVLLVVLGLLIGWWMKK